MPDFSNIIVRHNYIFNRPTNIIYRTYVGEFEYVSSMSIEEQENFCILVWNSENNQ